MSPQILNESEYTLKTDIWSLGIILYELMTGNLPYRAKNISQLEKKINKGTYKISLRERPSIECIDFLKKCLVFDEN